ncbi:MAG: response regulator [Opitutales bacterium]|nr:response regulator [Opitutales bacterium]
MSGQNPDQKASPLPSVSSEDHLPKTDAGEDQMVLVTRAEAEMLRNQADLARRAQAAFLANMSHEIRTPMNGVLGMLSLLLETDLNETQRQYAEIAAESGEALLKLLNNLLDLSKIEAGQLAEDRSDVCLQHFLDTLVEDFADPAREKRIEIFSWLSGESPRWVNLEAGRLRQVLSHLVSNAIKFTERGEVVIEVTAEAHVPGNDRAYLRFSVRDTGIGIDSDRVSDLFQKFSQVDTSNTRKYGGVGLGLAISHQIIELLGGEIGVVSERGVGSEFWFTLPCRAADPEPDHASPLPDISGQRILVVDDTPSGRRMLTACGHRLAARVDTAESAATALSLLREAKAANDAYVLTFIDRDLIEHSDRLAMEILGDKALASTRLIGLSPLKAGRSEGAPQPNPYARLLTKPIRHRELCRVFSDFAGKEAPGGNAASVPREPSPSALTPGQLKARILIAEDNKVNQVVAVGLLRRLGLRADSVGDGQEVLAALRARSYDLVLMDIQMPRLDGLATTQRIRSGRDGSPDPQIPIIAMTAHALAGDRERCLGAGMNDYLAKPVSLSKLTASLARWLPEAPRNVPLVPSEQSPAAQQLERRWIERGHQSLIKMRNDLEIGDAFSAASDARAWRESLAAVHAPLLTGLLRSFEKDCRSYDLERAHALLHDIREALGRL